MKIVRQFILFFKVSLTAWLGILSTVALSQTNDSSADVVIETADCTDFINESPPRVRCGFIRLPLNHDETNDNDRFVALPIMIAGSTQSLLSKSEKAIFIPGGGGPGGSIGFGYQYNPGEYLKPFTELRAAGFDVVIVDQRGAGYSKPRINCTESIDTFKLFTEKYRTLKQELSAYKLAAKKCRDRLTQDNVSLTAFDSYQSARDFIAIINSLPYSWWGTIATSYATVLAQAIEIIQPGVFDRIVLDSPVPIDFQQPATEELSQSAIMKILSLCENTSRCNSKYPQVTEKFLSILEQSGENPYSIKINVFDSSLSTQSEFDLVADNGTLLEIFLTAAYNNDGIASLPKTIHALHEGDTQSLQAFTEDYWYQATTTDFADALSLTVHCRERQPLEEEYIQQHPDYMATHSERTKLAIETQRLLCADWDVGTDSRIQTNIPFKTQTLIIAGDLDPVIRSDDIRNTVDNFTNAVTVVIPGMGHSAWYQSSCTRLDVLEFMAPSTEATNNDARVSCTGGLTRFK